MATLQAFYEQMTKMSSDEAAPTLEKHPGKSCDEAHPDQSHEEWAAGRKEDAEKMLDESGKTAADRLDPVKKTHQNWAPQTEEGTLYKSQLGEAITRSEDAGQEKEAMNKFAAAEYDAAGRIFARGFYDELEKVARFQMPSRGAAMKAVGRGGLYGGLGLAALAALASGSDPQADEMGRMGARGLERAGELGSAARERAGGALEEARFRAGTAGMQLGDRLRGVPASSLTPQASRIERDTAYPPWVREMVQAQGRGLYGNPAATDLAAELSDKYKP
jgi:ElaB/YqjD/DUF883 family membrane-anchored ribosome-binding protein